MIKKLKSFAWQRIPKNSFIFKALRRIYRLIDRFLFTKKTYYYKKYNIISMKEYCSKKELFYSCVFSQEKGFVYPPKYVGDNVQPNAISIMQPELYIAQIGNVEIFGETNVIIADENYAILDMAFHPRAGLYDFRDTVIHEIKKQTLTVKVKRAKKEKYLEKGVLLSGTASKNYYHWLFEFITKFSLLEEGGFQNYPLLVDEEVLNIPQFIEILEKCNNEKREVIAIKSGVKYKVKELLVPSFLCWGPLNVKAEYNLESVDTVVSKHAVEFLRGKFINKELVLQSRKKIYISRRNVKTSYRRFLNEEEILGIFSERGYEIIYPEEMTFSEQVECFSNASVIAGPTGAGFANIVFAPKECTVICFINARVDFSVWSTIAGHIGQKLFMIEGKASSDDIDIKYQRDYEANAKEVAEFLKINKL